MFCMRWLAAFAAALVLVSVVPTPAEAAPIVVGVVDSESTYVNFAQQGWDASRPVKIRDFLISEGYTVVELRDADLENPSTLASLDALYLPLTRVMSEEASLTIRSWVEDGGGLLGSFISPRMLNRPGCGWTSATHPRDAATAQQHWTCPTPTFNHGGFDFWALELNSNAWEFGPLSEAYQKIFINDPTPHDFSVISDSEGASHPIVTGVKSELGITSLQFDRPSGAGAEFSRTFNTNATSLLEFDIAPGTGSAEGVETGQYDGYTAAQAIEYGAGRIVYFDFDIISSLASMNATQAGYLHQGVAQGDIAESLIRHSIDWAAGSSSSTPIVRDARTWAEVDIYNTGIYVRQYLEVNGNVSTLGDLTLRIYDPAGTLVYEHTRELIGLFPGAAPLMYSQPQYYVASGLSTAGTYRVEASYIYNEPDNSELHIDAVEVSRNQGTNILTSPVATGPLPDRIAGADRYATAVEISKEAWSSGVDSVYMATALNFPDALAGSAIATDGPILLTTGTGIPGVTAGELSRLNPGRIVILGGTGVVSAWVETQLASYTSGPVVRLAGSDRYSTSEAISQHGFPGGASKVYVATGENFPDALAGGPQAANDGAPILLTARDSVPTATWREVQRLDPDSIVILGGSGVVSDAVADQLATVAPVVRVAGADRNSTAAAISQLGNTPPATVVYIATNSNFPDALAGGVLATVDGGPILLVSTGAVPAATATELIRLGPDRIVILGGVGAVSESVRSQLAAYQTGS